MAWLYQSDLKFQAVRLPPPQLNWEMHHGINRYNMNIMKKNHYLITLFAALVLMAGCQKEQDYVTLGVVADQPSKVYIDNSNYPCWHNGDKVYINNDTYSISGANGHSAQIERVVADDAYRAIYPASLVAQGSSIGNLESVPITLPSTQVYEQDGNGHQRVNLPMGAYITSGTTLQFYNLCSVVRVTVSNQLSTNLSLSGIIIEAEHAFLSGQGTATVSGQSSDHITMSNTASHSVRLNFSGTATATVNAHGDKPFDIVVPAFASDNVTITLITTDGQYCELPLTGNGNGVALANNTVTTVTVNVTELNLIPAAELVDGPTFNAAIPDNATAIVFEYNNPAVTSGTLLSTTNSPTPIYGNLDGTTWRISTSSSVMNANPDCSSMFQSDNLEKIRGDYVLTSVDFGNGFNTSNVTSMSSMFFGCIGFTSFDLSCFNTSNVIDMIYMFGECQNLTSLNLSSFNTSNVTRFAFMFMNCQSLINLDLSSFNTLSATDMSCMFSSCYSLASLDLSSFNTSNVENIWGMFESCSSLTSLNLSNFNTSRVLSMTGMFVGCSSLMNLDISNFNTSSVGDMSGMFEGCSSLTSLDLSHFNTSNVVSMSYVFADCSSLTSLNLSNFDMSHLGWYEWNNNWHTGKEGMCAGLSSLSGHCTITCPSAVESAIKEVDTSYDPSDSYHPYYYISGLPTIDEVTFTWVRPSSSK